MKLNLGSLLVIAAAVAAMAWFNRNVPWTPMRIAGAAIAAPALLLLLVARLQLGRSFSIQAKASHLVTTGLYSRIRNPIYFFGSFFVVGIILWMSRPVYLLILAIIIPMQIARARREEQVLVDKFGDAYLQYKSRTWF